jgi:hypothetical protein
MTVGSVRTRGGIAGLLIGIVAVVVALLLMANKSDNTTTWVLLEELVGFFGAVLAALAVHQLVD